MTFTDSHCHLHDSEFFPSGGEAEYKRALASGVERVICVGTDVRSSKEAFEFTKERAGTYCAYGIHPHDSEKQAGLFDEFRDWCLEHNGEKTVAVGEVGLDYHYMNSPKDRQIELFEKQIDMALVMDVPLVFHVRDAFEDFWSVLNNFPAVRGVLHSFTDTRQNMEKGVERGLFIGVNGIATFARDLDDITKTIPLENLLLETDAPYLTPTPLRGKINEPGNVPLIASFVAELRGITVEELSRRTEANVTRLFLPNR